MAHSPRTFTSQTPERRHLLLVSKIASQILPVEGRIEVGPIRVHVFDEAYLPISPPFLEGLLARDSFVDPVIFLIPNKSMDIVLRCK